MIPIPAKIRKQLDADPEYQECMLRGVKGHSCGGRPNTREHAIIFKGARLQEKWAIISICAKAHEVDEYQDARTMNKELNVWVALNRATDEELTNISKAMDYHREKRRLNGKYGVWVPRIPIYSDVGIKY